MNGVNAFFYAQLAIWAGLMLANRDTEDFKSYYKVRLFDTVNKLLPAILMIISILFIRLKLRRKQTMKVYSIEKLITVHIAIFLTYVIVYTASLFICLFWFH